MVGGEFELGWWGVLRSDVDDLWQWIGSFTGG